MKNKLHLAVDAGGTLHKAALFDGMSLVPGSFIRVPSRSDGSREEIEEGFRTLADEAVKTAVRFDAVITAACVGIPGPFEYATGMLRMDHKFRAARDLSVTPWLRESLGEIPIRFLHDSTAFFRGGVHREGLEDAESICGVIIGTGLGFACMKQGRILSNSVGGPGISIWARPYRDSIAEDYVSRRGVLRRFEALSHRRDLDVREIADLARAGDSAARETFRGLGQDLGAIVGPIMEENRFTVLLLGGAISKSADLMFPTLERELASLSFPAQVRAVRDIDLASLYGAAAVCLES